MARDKRRSVPRLSDFELTADQEIRHRIAVAMHIDIALDVNEAVMKRVHLRDEERQRLKVGPFGGEELTAGSHGDDLCRSR